MDLPKYCSVCGANVNYSHCLHGEISESKYCRECGRSLGKCKHKQKFILEFDEEPALVFVQHKTGDIREAELYQDGKKVKGWRSVRIKGAIDEFTSHEIEYLTGLTKDGD